MLIPQTMALTATIVCSVAYIMYSISIAFYPHFMFKWHAPMIHLVNYERYLPDFRVTLQSFFLGLAQVIFHTYITVWVIIRLYNYLAGVTTP